MLQSGILEIYRLLPASGRRGESGAKVEIDLRIKRKKPRRSGTAPRLHARSHALTWADEVSRMTLIICIRTTSTGRGWAACHEQDLRPGVCEEAEFFFVTVMALRESNDVIALIYFHVIGRQNKRRILGEFGRSPGQHGSTHCMVTNAHHVALTEQFEWMRGTMTVRWRTG